MDKKLINKLYLGSMEGLEQKLAEEINLIKKDAPLLPVKIIVESNLTGIYLRRLLVCRGVNHININFCTFSDLVRELTEQCKTGKIKKSLPYYGEERITRILADNIQGESYFAPVAGYKGFSTALKQSFQELREAGILPDNLGANKGNELSSLYKDYMNIIKDYSDQLSCYEELSSLDIPGINQAAIYVFGVYKFTNIQKKLLSFLFSKTKFAAFMPLFLLSQPHGQRLITWFEENGFVKEDAGSVSLKNTLEHLQNRLFLSGSFSAGDDSSLEVWSAPGEVREVKEIGRKIISFAADGYAFQDMAVLVKDKSYYSLIEETFRTIGLPYYLPAGVTLFTTRSGSALAMWLQLADSGWSRRELMELLDIAPFDYRRILGVNHDISVPLWDYLTLEAGITTGLNNPDKKLKILISRLRDINDKKPGAEKREQSDHSKLLQKFLAKLLSISDGVPAEGSWSDIVGYIENFIKKFFRDGEETEAILNALRPLQGLDSIEGKVNFYAVRDMILNVLEGTFLSRGGFQRGGVTVCPLNAAQNIRFKITFIPGMLEGVFPAPFRQDPLIPDEERKLLGGKIPLRREAVQREALSFAAAVDTASEKLILSFPRFNSRSGKEQLPSNYLLKTGEALSGKHYSADAISEIPGFRYISSAYVPPPGDTLSESEFDFALINSGQPDNLLKDYFSKRFPWYTASQGSYRNRLKDCFTVHEGMTITPEARLLLSGKFSPWKKPRSVTFLSDYISCPYLFFLKYIMNITGLQEPEEQLRMDNMEKGTLVHGILETFYRSAKEENLFPLNPANLNEAKELMKKALDKCFQQAEEEGTTGYPLYWKIDRESIKDDMSSMLEHEANLDYQGIPSYFEIPFGISGEKTDGAGINTAEPVSFSAGNEKADVFFRGRIDRIDFDDDKIRIIDYKTGKVRVTEKTLSESISLQLSIYILAAKKLFHRENSDDITAAYYYVSRKSGFKKAEYSGETLAKNRSLFERAISVIYDGITGGKFFPYPVNKGKDCSWCEYTGICGTEIEKIFKRKENDTQIKEFLEIIEHITFA